LSCHSNQLTALDVSNCSELAMLWCYGNRMFFLDLMDNKKLKGLHIDMNVEVISSRNFNKSLDIIRMD